MWLKYCKKKKGIVWLRNSKFSHVSNVPSYFTLETFTFDAGLGDIWGNYSLHQKSEALVKAVLLGQVQEMFLPEAKEKMMSFLLHLQNMAVLGLNLTSALMRASRLELSGLHGQTESGYVTEVGSQVSPTHWLCIVTAMACTHTNKGYESLTNDPFPALLPKLQ